LVAQNFFDMEQPDNGDLSAFIKSLYSSGHAKTTIMNTLESYVDLETNTFAIPYELWQGWRNGNTELFLDCLNEFIEKHNLSLPYPYNENECYNDFCKLSRMDASQLMTVLHNEIVFH
jgi:hypothetical protein